MSFTLKYAVKELKKRPRDFLPVLLASLGVMILVFNLVIYLESRRITDISYYKLDFEFKLYEMTEKDILALEPLPYIKNIHKMNDTKGTYTLYIGFTSPTDHDYHAILRAAERLMNEQNMWRRPFYNGQYAIYEEWGLDFFRENNHWFNTQYLDALLAQSFLSPEMFVTMLAASLLMGATMTLVFNLKFKKNISEYASLRSMGMTTFNILKINMFQGIGIMTLCLPFTASLSAVVMKAVCSASHTLYPEIKDNTPLTYVFPTGYVISSFMIMTAVSGMAILLLCRLYNQKSIVELTRGTALLKISFVEKSSDKFEKSGNFAFYGKLHDKRTRRTRASVTALSMCLLIMPVMFTYTVVYLISDVASRAFSRDPDEYAMYVLMAAVRSNGYIPKSIVDEIEALDGIIKVSHSPRLSASSIIKQYTNSDAYYTGSVTSSDNRKYETRDVDEYDDWHMNYIGTVVLSGKIEDLEKNGMIAVYEDSGFSVGDKVTVSYSKYKCEATVAAVLKLTSKTEAHYGGKNSSTTYPIYCGMYTLTDFMEIPRDDIRFTWQVGIYGEVGREDELIEQIEDIAGVQDQFKSTYEQWQYQTGIAGENVYLTMKKNDTVTLFMTLFVAAQILFLYVSGGMIISSVTDFNINTRKREFAVIRSLGSERENIIALVKRSALTGAVICAAAAVVIGTGLAIGTDRALFEGGILEVLKRIGNYIAKGVLSYIFVLAYSVLLHLIVSVRSVKRITGDSLIKDIRDI